MLTRDIRTCRPGRAQYTVWCDDRGFVNEDGVVYRFAHDDFLLTSAEPNLAYLRGRVGGDRVEISEVTDDVGVLAVQGPRSRAILHALDPGVARLACFDHVEATIGKSPVTIARTGFTGDLGYEVFCAADDAHAVWDAIFEAGSPHGLTPFGQTALLMARIEAGLLLLHVDFEPSRLAENDEQRSTPSELGLEWMLRGIDDETRPFVGRDAIRRELAERTSRWSRVGLVVDWADHVRAYTGAGLMPQHDHRPLHGISMVYDTADELVGSATSSMYSPVLQRHVALARVRPDLATPGTQLQLEFTVDHRYVNVAASVTRGPLFDPPRRTSMAEEAAA